MAKPLVLSPDRLFPANLQIRDIARRLYTEIANLPIISPHGHTDPAWFADNTPFENPSALFIEPDHYIYRMLYSQGIALDALGVRRTDGSRADVDPRDAWSILAANYHLFRGTPSRSWLDWVFAEAFGIDVTLTPETAHLYYETIDTALRTEAFRPRALFNRFNIEVITTTEGALDGLNHHQVIRAENARAGGWQGRVLTAYRPDGVVDPEFEGFAENLAALGDMTGEDTHSWHGYLAAHRQRRAFFKAMGATSTDHGHPTARTANLTDTEAAALFGRIRHGANGEEAELFRAQMLTEMARMSLDDGLVMQIHPGSCRNHNARLFAHYGRDKGADIPMRTDYVHALRPLLDVVGNETALSIILFTLDESVYARELAPLAGHYPCLKLGPSWWFHDSPEGMRRFRQMTTETAGFYNTVGFNDDTRAFLSIPARHDVARRMDCGWLAELVADHRLDEDEAAELVVDLAYNLAKRAYRL